MFSSVAIVIQVAPPPPWLVGWFALGASLLSLGISIATFVLTQRRPRVKLVLPQRVRVSGVPEEATAFIYVQPIFVNVGRSTRAEVLDEIRMNVTSPDSKVATFEYFDRARTVWDATRREVHVEYFDEAAPIIVGQNSVKSEMLTFKAPRGWQFRTGAYSCEFVATLQTSMKDVRGSFAFAVSDDNIRLWTESAGKRFAMLSTDRGSPPREHRAG